MYGSIIKGGEEKDDYSLELVDEPSALVGVPEVPPVVGVVDMLTVTDSEVKLQQVSDRRNEGEKRSRSYGAVHKRPAHQRCSTQTKFTSPSRFRLHRIPSRNLPFVRNVRTPNCLATKRCLLWTPIGANGLPAVDQSMVHTVLNKTYVWRSIPPSSTRA